MKRYFEGSEAARIGEVTQNILMDFLRAALLADAAMIALCPGGVLVTGSLATASARFKIADNQAFVLLMQNAHNDPFQRLKELDETGNVVTIHPGRRHEWTFAIQMSARNDQAARSGPSNTSSQDRRLADFVVKTFADGYFDLQTLGVMESGIKADADNQNNPNCINPHVLKCVTYTIETPQTLAPTA